MYRLVIPLIIAACLWRYSLGSLGSDDGWIELEFDSNKKTIPWRWEDIPLQIKTDSVVGSGDKIGIDMKRPHLVGGIAILFSSPIKFWMPYCSTQGGEDSSEAYAELPVQPPDEVDKIWTFTKTGSAFVITCNGVEVLNYEFATSGFSNCAPKWGGDTTDHIVFYKSWSTASDFYRAGKFPRMSYFDYSRTSILPHPRGKGFCPLNRGQRCPLNGGKAYLAHKNLFLP
uniref:Putative secretory peptide-42 n=1 Tax=Pleurobrachia bachei TaxID=34499 RepID=M4H1D9_PLEBA|nr:putative secretory peptide-42 [Pleurobrachia bachei]|eukprot:sb/3469542/